MEIPEISESQLRTMLSVCRDPQLSVFSQTSPIDADPLAFKVVLGQAQKDVDHLVALKLLKEITADHLEQIEKTNEESGRNWKVYEVTALGRAMFQAYTQPGVN